MIAFRNKVCKEVFTVVLAPRVPGLPAELAVLISMMDDNVVRVKSFRL